MDAAAHALHARAQHGPQPLVQPIDPAAEFILGRDDELGSRRRSRRAEVGDEVGNGDVGLVADAGDDRHGNARDGACDHLLVERPEIFDRSAAAREDDDVDASDTANLPQRARHVRRRVRALHPRRAYDQMDVRVASTEHVDDVADGRAVERGDDADLARQRRQRPLARRVEEPLVLQPFLQLIERELQRAEAVRLEVLAHELVLALRLVHRDLAARDDSKTVFRLELQISERGAEDDRADLRSTVLQREIQVSGRIPHAAAGQLAFDPDLVELLLDQVAEADRKVGDRENPTIVRRSSFAVRRGRSPFVGRRLVLLKRKIEQIRHRQALSVDQRCN